MKFGLREIVFFGLMVGLLAASFFVFQKSTKRRDALQKEMGGPDFAVVAINIDTRNLDKPKGWLAENKVTNLAYYSDPQASTFQLRMSFGSRVMRR